MHLQRKLCQFIKGLIEGVSEHYKTPITYSKKSCMLDGAEYCEFDLTFLENKA